MAFSASEFAVSTASVIAVVTSSAASSATTCASVAATCACVAVEVIDANCVGETFDAIASSTAA